MTQDNHKYEYRSGEQLLAEWTLPTREAALAHACRLLMAELERLHVNHQEQSLAENLTNTEIYCSCADAYRMGHAALEMKS